MPYFSKKYRNYLQSKKWRKKRQAALHYYGHSCQACGTRRKPLHVHHVTYVRLMKERLGDLRILCPKCHDEVHKIHRSLGRKKSLRVVTNNYITKKRKGSNR